MPKHDVKDMGLAKKGMSRIEWAAMDMPVLENIKKRFRKDKPLKGLRVSACLHVTTETANLMDTLRLGGAAVVLCASNPLSTQDDVAAACTKYFKVPTYAIKGENNDTYYKHIMVAADHKAQITMDDGAGRQAVGGLCQEIVDRMERRGAVHYPPKSEWNDPDAQLVEHYSRWGLTWGRGPHRVRYSVAFEPHEFIFAADEMLSEAGVRPLYHTWACEPLVEDGAIRAVVIQNKAGRQAIAAK
ncbi:hypothetical protein LCGC14_2805270, partial [marine sediment metagenome]